MVGGELGGFYETYKSTCTNHIATVLYVLFGNDYTQSEIPRWNRSVL